MVQSVLIDGDRASGTAVPSVMLCTQMRRDGIADDIVQTSPEGRAKGAHAVATIDQRGDNHPRVHSA